MADPKKILVIQLKRAGDVIVTTPVLPVLKEHFPEMQLDFLTYKAFAPLLENNPYIGHVHAYDPQQAWVGLRHVRAEGYDWIFDFQSSPRSALICRASGASLTAGYRVPFWGFFYSLTVSRPRGAQSVVDGKMTLIEAAIGKISKRSERRIYLRAEEEHWAGEILNPGRVDSLVGLVPTHRRESRRWSADSFAALARRLQKAGHHVWLFWGPGEENYVEDIRQQAPGSHMIPSASLRQMAALLARCRLVVTNDNGPMHLAVAVKTPTVTLYGPTDPLCWNPGGSQHPAVQVEGLSCLGCNLNVCPFEHECMRQVAPDKVFDICQQFLKLPMVELTS